MNKPVKKTVAEALVSLPQVREAIERERQREQNEWIDATADMVRNTTGLPNDIAFVAAKRSRTFHTAEVRARNIAEMLVDLQRYR